MEQFAPVLINAGVAGVVLGWFMLRLEKQMQASTRAQLQMALQMVQLRLVVPQLPDFIREQAEKDAKTLSGKIAQLPAAPPAENGGAS